MKRVGHALGLAIGLLGVAFVVRELVRNRDEVVAAAGDAQLLPLVLAAVLGLASMTSIGLGWRRCLAVLGHPRTARDALPRYFVGQLGKYVPGGIWPVIGRAEMARRGGVPAPAAYASTLLSLALTYLAAILTAASALLIGAAGGGGGTAWWPVLVLLPVGVLALHPVVVARGLALLRRATRRELGVPVPRWPTSVGLLVRHVPAWLGISGATWLVAATIDPGRVDGANVVLATTLSWVVGFLVVGVPGGIGVREAVFVATATSLSSTGVAAAVAVVARALFIVVDLSGAGLTALLARRDAGASRPLGEG